MDGGDGGVCCTGGCSVPSKAGVRRENGGEKDTVSGGARLWKRVCMYECIFNLAKIVESNNTRKCYGPMFFGDICSKEQFNFGTKLATIDILGVIFIRNWSETENK